jgi:hypothetical protein
VLACFKIASLILQNGFVPGGEASHAVAAITRHREPANPGLTGGLPGVGEGHLNERGRRLGGPALATCWPDVLPKA